MSPRTIYTQEIDMLPSEPVITELIAINYAKRELHLLPDNWYFIDEAITMQGRYNLLPNQTDINTAKSVIRPTQ